MLNTLFTNFLTELKKQLGTYRYEIKCGRLLSQIMRRSSFIFKENHVFIEEEENLSNKVAMVEEELDGIDMDDIGNLMDLPRLMLINVEC